MTVYNKDLDLYECWYYANDQYCTCNFCEVMGYADHLMDHIGYHLDTAVEELASEGEKLGEVYLLVAEAHRRFHALIDKLDREACL